MDSTAQATSAVLAVAVMGDLQPTDQLQDDVPDMIGSDASGE